MAASIKLTLKSVMPIKHRKTCIFRLLRRFSTVHAAADTDSRKWQLHSAVCLQRYPVITQEMNDLEARYCDLKERAEMQRSLLSDHELELKRMREQKEATIKKTKTSAEEATVVEQIVTALDLEEEWKKHEVTFTPASRITEADKANDMKSLERALSRKLTLIVRQQFGTGEPVWTLPQIHRAGGESMRQAAERALSTCCGDAVDATFIGNAPCGYYHYKLPQSYDEFGTKLFFFKATYNAGNATETEHVKDYKWVTRDELKDYFPRNYLRVLKQFIIEY